MIEIAACAEVDEDELAVSLHDNIRRMRVGMEGDIVVEAPEARVHQPPGHQFWIDVQLAHARNAARVLLLNRGQHLEQPHARRELLDDDLVVRIFEIYAWRGEELAAHLACAT